MQRLSPAFLPAPTIFPRRLRRPLRAHATMTAPLAGKRALVTGASRGIGRGAAIALSSAGAHVLATGRSKASLDETAALAAAAGGVVEACVVDAGDDGEVARFFRQIRDAGDGLDIVVSNAFSGVGIVMGNAEKDFWDKRVGEGEGEEMPGKYWDELMNVGLRSNYLTIVEAVRCMREVGRGGLIVNISSFGCVALDSVRGLAALVQAQLYLT